MGQLQWVLLIVCVVLVIALYVLSRRSKKLESDEVRLHAASPGRSPSTGQMDLLAPRQETSFDEYGVGRARKRGEGTEPETDEAEIQESDDAEPVIVVPPPAPREAVAVPPPLVPPRPAPTPMPSVPAIAPRLIAPMTTPPARPAPVPAAESSSARKPIALIIAPSEETDILGPALHHALVGQGLRYGSGEVYHRMIGGQSVYSIASLIKPGTLIPTQAQYFSTKGLLIVMSLPGPVLPGVALEDLIVTARNIASALRADIYDGRRQRLTEEVATALRAEVEDWARSHKPG
ncbi:MAG: cell division protein ZipA C-terminal FtsZ-binding domain-containing protein [Panacagrimonas sp.]